VYKGVAVLMERLALSWVVVFACDIGEEM